MVTLLSIVGGCAVAASVVLLIWALALRRSLGRARRLATARGAEVEHLAAVRAPAMAERLGRGQRYEGIPGPLGPESDTGEDFSRAVESVVAALGSDEAVRRERALRDSVQTAFESVARSVHAMATVQQQVLDRVERCIEDAALMAEVMQADHAAAQMTRKAQTLLVMCGVWPGRRETRPVSLYDCVRGAQSRIVEFGRVEVHGGQMLHVVPTAVEGLMHAIAELLENATVFSPSSSQVVVTISEVGAGAVVEIDDAGVGMPPDVLHQATARLRDDLDLTRLGAVPRLGLACVGRWARELGFQVELTAASAYGGTRAVTFVPYRLLTDPPPRPSAARHGTAAAQPRTATAFPRTDAGAAAGASAHPADGGLPRRRSRRGARQTALHQGLRTPPGATSAFSAAAPTAYPASAAHPPPAASADRPWTPEDARASIADVLSGTRRGRSEAENSRTPEGPDHKGGRP
ncbi:ATP-binding protein [Streptomyces sp. SCSIO 30461]|uniref:ATP-binding protein n=1 Tax=Streptomyces sp. SCSIO 30461 TaxID=3118085 RepID=UPI0030CA9B79